MSFTSNQPQWELLVAREGSRAHEVLAEVDGDRAERGARRARPAVRRAEGRHPAARHRRVVRQRRAATSSCSSTSIARRASAATSCTRDAASRSRSMRRRRGSCGCASRRRARVLILLAAPGPANLVLAVFPGERKKGQMMAGGPEPIPVVFSASRTLPKESANHATTYFVAITSIAASAIFLSGCAKKEEATPPPAAEPARPEAPKTIDPAKFLTQPLVRRSTRPIRRRMCSTARSTSTARTTSTPASRRTTSAATSP